MVGLGTTLRCNLAPRHIWIVLSDPSAHGGRLLMVNLTTLHDDSVDDVCILGPGDYELLDRATTVAYSRAQIGNLDGLERAIARGYFTPIKPIPDRTLHKIIEGGRRSPELPPAAKKLLPQST